MPMAEILKAHDALVRPPKPPPYITDEGDPMTNNEIICIDGMSATGKTTLAEHLAEAYGLSYFHTDFDAATVGWSPIHNMDKPLIMDRWWASTVIYSRNRWVPRDIGVLGATAEAPFRVSRYYIVVPEDTPEGREVHRKQMARKAATGPLTIASSHSDVFGEERKRWLTTRFPRHCRKVMVDHTSEAWLAEVKADLESLLSK